MRSASFFLIIILAFIFVLSCTSTKNAKTSGVPPYVPENKELYDTIVQMDSILFDSYNNCKLNVFASLVSEDIEFFHDRGGLDTSKNDIVQAIKNNICGKVTRELLKGSIEVYPIPNYGAVEMGAHRFYNNQEKDNGPSRFSKFVTVWHRENGNWRISRVISLH
ncbi:MAG: nuclear transport factor 2 family protein [Flavisolibacter sp.]